MGLTLKRRTGEVLTHQSKDVTIVIKVNFVRGNDVSLEINAPSSVVILRSLPQNVECPEPPRQNFV